jgi:hypothetical protein
MRSKWIALAAFIAVAGCSRQPHTDQELLAAAHQKVDRAIDRQAVFSMEEAVVAQQIACGHADYDGNPLGRDFVYRKGQLLLDSDPNFDAAAAQCDKAAAEAGEQDNGAME